MMMSGGQSGATRGKQSKVVGAGVADVLEVGERGTDPEDHCGGPEQVRQWRKEWVVQQDKWKAMRERDRLRMLAEDV